MGGCNLPKDNPGLSQGTAQTRRSLVAASTSPTPSDLCYLLILTQPASPWLCQHAVKPAGNEEGEPRRERAPMLQVPVGWGSPSCSRCR